MCECLVNCRVLCPEKQVPLSSQEGVVLEKTGDLHLSFLICKTDNKAGYDFIII